MADVNLPQGWLEVALSDIADWGSGGTPSRKMAHYFCGQIPWIKTGELGDKFVRSSEEKITEEAILSSSAKIFPRGSVGIAMYGATIGKTSIFGVDASTNQACAVGMPSKSINNEFLYYFLLSEKNRFIKAGTGGAQPNISQGVIKNWPIKLPPLAEQHRIVAKIEELFSELDKGVENLRTAQQQLNIYRKTLLKNAFEGKLTADWRSEQKSLGKLSSVDETLKATPAIPRPNRWKTRTKDIVIGHSALAIGNPETVLPEGWRWVPMVDIARMESGHTPSKNHPEWWIGEIPWISIPDARQNHGEIILNTNQKTNDQGLANSAARLLPTGTVCISRTASVGYVVELGRPMATSQDFVNWTPSSAVTSEWLRLVFGADRETLMRFGKGTTHKTIYFPEWLSVHIGLPSIEEQRRIVEVVDEKLSILDQLEKTITHSLQQAEALRQSILKKAFSGQLVAQDANDKPASVLLARIKAEKQAKPASGKRTPCTTPAALPANAVAMPVRIPGIASTDLHAGILALAYSAHEADPKYLPYFGHVKGEKVSHLVEAHLGIELDRAPVKDAAGPNDYPHLKKVESRARKVGWFDMRREPGATAYSLHKLAGFNELQTKTRQVLGSRLSEVEALLRLLLPLKTRQAEIVATLYAAWNNLLLAGAQPSDQQIIFEARDNWHPDKLKIELWRFEKGLVWMREQKLTPRGQGRRVEARHA